MKAARTLTIIVSTALLSAVALGSARQAFAQDASDDGASSAASIATPDNKPNPVDFHGCWDGTNIVGSLQDENYGSGYGWIGIIQNHTNIKSGAHGSYYEFVWDSGNDWAKGPLKGKATATGFTATGKAGGKCKVKIVATPGTNNDIVGSYDFQGCEKSGFDAVGTFDLPLNNSGCSNIIP